MKKWVIKAKSADFNAIAERHNISPILARLIVNRGVVDDAQIDMYLNGKKKDMYSPFLLKDMDITCVALLKAIHEKKHIRVVGDYDIDGVCATTILVRGLKHFGANVSSRLPHRIRDGYGLNKNIIEEAKQDGVDVILTCDNGIAAYDEIVLARELGIDVFITDHHEVPYDCSNGEKVYKLPPANAIINPHREDDMYPFKEICGGMVAYKLIMALNECIENKEKSLDEKAEEIIFELAAFATVGDIMPLCDENRIAVKEALLTMANTKNIGLSSLMDVQGVKRENLSPYHIGFILGPCINAAGRLDTADIALELLLTEDVDKALSIAKRMRELNEERKNIEDKKLKEAFDLIDNSSDGHDYSKDTVLFIYIPECHESIAGLIAGKLREKYSKPSVVFTDAASCLKGSGRSIDAYNMHDEFMKFNDLFLKFGGHPLACGLSIEKEKFEEVRKTINEASTLSEDDLIEKYCIDIDMPINYVDDRLLSELERLKPFGQGNSAPVFAQKNLTVLSRKGNAKGNYLTLQVKTLPHNDKPEKTMFATMFCDSNKVLSELDRKDKITMAYVPEYNDYFERIQLSIKELKY